MDVDRTLYIRLYKKMFLIRVFEAKVEEMFRLGKLRGTTHGCIGQEAVAVGVLENVDLSRDYVTGTHRSHGHFLALTGKVFELISELMGKKTGIVRGKGGSQHLHYGNFYTNGITGGMIPVAVGLGMAKKLKGEEGVVISFLGDGGMNEGYVMEALNLAGVYKTPNIFVLENNRYAMSTITENFTSGKFEERIKGFGLEYHCLKVLDVVEVYRFFKKIYEKVREEKYPVFIEFETYRFCGHSKSDRREYVVKEWEDFWHANDPLEKCRNRIPAKVVEDVEKEIMDFVEEEFRRALAAPYPDPGEDL